MLETKAILFNLFRDYLATPEQKADGIADYNNEREELFGTISRSKL